VQVTDDTFASRQVFADSDEFAASVSNTDLEYSLLASRQRDWILSEARLDTMQVFAGQMGAATTVTGSTLPSIHSFFIPLDSSFEWCVNGRKAADKSLGYLGPGAVHVVTTREPTDWLLLQADVGILEPFLREQGHDDEWAPVSIFEPEPHALENLKLAIRTAIVFGQSQPGRMQQAVVRENLRNALLSSLSAAIPSSGRGPAMRQDVAAARIQTIFEERGESAVTSAELRLALSISERSLRRVFHEMYGTSPARYLRHRRLHLARRALRDPTRAASSVTDVCFGLGFFDPGRFAVDYRKLFGESPSVTLKRARHVVEDDERDQ